MLSLPSGITIAVLSSSFSLESATLRLNSERRLRLDRDLQNSVRSSSEQLIGIFDLFQRKSVRQQLREIDPAMSDYFHQSAHPFFAARTQAGDDAMISETRSESVIR